MARLFAALLGVLTVSLALLAKPPEAPRKEPEPVPEDWYSVGYCGTVVSVGDDGLVIKPTRWFKTLVIDHKLDGTLRERFYLQDNSKPPSAYKFCDSLFPNRPGPKSGRVGEHEVADLKAGDFVLIARYRREGVEYCNSIQIQRRWGGLVPHAIGDKDLEAKDRAATRWNNEQRNEERAYALAGRVLRNFGR
jgi:hypothetical protein